ncbi:ABC transporter ATP-binding protein [Acutalibacter caecimuris]|uniref:ABC transporter ATP-binding protein n=1 Tax=Acutalibacter caecimuris TaxID=3093657 RepID=UPI002AC8A078|nr:ABC transporter ATP-binding protein [Acutalibacter sp. M00118]
MKKRSVIRLFWQCFSYLGPARWRYVLGLLLSCFEFALLFALPYVNRALLDIITGAREDNIFLALLAMLGLFLLLAPPVVYGAYLRATCSELATARLRKELFRHIAHMPYERLTGYRTGDYITRLTSDANRCGYALGGFSVVQLLRFAAVFPVTLVLLLRNDWRIALAGVLYGSINMALSLYLNPRAKQQEAVAKGEIANSASFLVEALRSMPVVRVFVMREAMAARYRAICQTIRQKRMKYQNIIGLTYGVVDFFAQSAQAVGFILGILLAKEGQTLGQAAFNATLMGMMGDAIYRLSTFLLLSQANLVAMERVQGVLDQPLEDLETGHTQVDTGHAVAVDFRGVSFSYDGKTNVIEGLDLTLHRGERLAIVGGSGGGKSTIVKLIEGFYTPTAGEIVRFGQTGLSLAATRALFAYVPQECTLFDGTIGENILLGRQGATQAQVEEAARTADIHDFILSLPEGYQAQAGEQGGQLSGGQRQRIAIARALLKDAPVLLLDEATASLDSAAEKEVQQCLDRIAQDRTTVTVAHRLSTIENADRILVMEGGKVVEEGGFHQLMAKGGRFKALYDSQQQAERLGQTGVTA